MSNNLRGGASAPGQASRVLAGPVPNLLQQTMNRVRNMEIGPLLALIALIVIFSTLSAQFFTLANFSAILENSAIPLVLVVGMTFVLLQGSIDLSIEGNMAASSILVSLVIANSITNSDIGLWVIPLAIVFGAIFGLFNGLLYTLLRMPSLIVTLATWFIGLGIATLLFPGRQPTILDDRLTGLFLDRPLGISWLVVLALCVIALGVFLERKTQFGRMSLAIGADEKLTRLSGRPVLFHKTMAFVLIGMLAGIAGVMITAQLGVGNPQAGTGYLFPTISAAVIGGTLLSGGRGGVLASVTGVMILEVLRSGMIQIGLDPYLRHIFEGAIIIVALVVGNWQLRSRLRVVK